MSTLNGDTFGYIIDILTAFGTYFTGFSLFFFMGATISAFIAAYAT